MASLLDFTGITKLRDAWPKWKANIIAVNNQIIAHVAGTADKHAAQDITYIGGFTGKTDVKAAIDQAKTEIDTIVISASIDPEVAFARESLVKAKTFSTIDARFEESEQDLVTYQADNATLAPKPNGVDDTIAFKACLDLASGKDVRVPSGIYIIDGLNLPSKASLIMDDNAVLLAKPNSPTGYMFTSNITLATIALKIRGGTIDGNKLNQTGRPSILIGYCPTGSYIDIQHVTFKDTVKNCVNINGFGGLIDLSHNKFIGQAEATGVDDEATSIMSVMSGQPNADGFVRFSHNICIGTSTPVVEGGSPGGIFLCNRDDVGDITHGNVSTLEAIGNYFYGYGLNCGINDISPIHTYPSWGGVRIIGNYFEQCGFCAISGKSVQDFICSNNVIINGQVSAKNIDTEGAISYVPGYMAGTNSRPRAVITGNIIQAPGGQTGNTQSGISIRGTDLVDADTVVVSNNVISNVGTGLYLDYVTNANLCNNIIKASLNVGIIVYHAGGDTLISGSRVETINGDAITCSNESVAARLFISDNILKPAGAARFGALCRGCALVKFSGNTFDVPSENVAVDVRGNGTSNVGHFIWDASNTILAGITSFGWATIDKASGCLRGTSSPLNVVTPAEIGTKYIQTDGIVGAFLWHSLGITANSWVATEDTGLASLSPTVVTSTGAGTGATASVIGSDVEGKITVNTGTDLAIGGGIVTLTFNSQRATAPRGVIIAPGNGNAVTKIASVVAYDTQLTVATFALHQAGTALVASSPYIWYYKVLV